MAPRGTGHRTTCIDKLVRTERASARGNGSRLGQNPRSRMGEMNNAHRRDRTIVAGRLQRIFVLTSWYM